LGVKTNKKKRKIGKLENWKIGKLENWKIGKLENIKYFISQVIYIYIYEFT
jgi:hypothetical protein